VHLDDVVEEVGDAPAGAVLDGGVEVARGGVCKAAAMGLDGHERVETKVEHMGRLRRLARMN
jgi:hypothetical protein